MRLETAGVRSTGHKFKTEINEINSDHVLMTWKYKVEQSVRRNNQLKERLDGLEELVAKLSDSKVTSQVSWKFKENRKRFNDGRSNNNGRKCRNCGSQSHFVKVCLNRFCQSFEQRGHDAWDTSCPKYS